MIGAIVAGGQAAQRGALPGDRIISVDGVPFDGNKIFESICSVIRSKTGPSRGAATLSLVLKRPDGAKVQKVGKGRKRERRSGVDDSAGADGVALLRCSFCSWTCEKAAGMRIHKHRWCQVAKQVRRAEVLAAMCVAEANGTLGATVQDALSQMVGAVALLGGEGGEQELRGQAGAKQLQLGHGMCVRHAIFGDGQVISMRGDGSAAVRLGFGIAFFSAEHLNVGGPIELQPPEPDSLMQVYEMLARIGEKAHSNAAVASSKRSSSKTATLAEANRHLAALSRAYMRAGRNALADTRLRRLLLQRQRVAEAAALAAATSAGGKRKAGSMRSLCNEASEGARSRTKEGSAHGLKPAVDALAALAAVATSGAPVTKGKVCSESGKKLKPNGAKVAAPRPFQHALPSGVDAVFDGGQLESKNTAAEKKKGGASSRSSEATTEDSAKEATIKHDDSETESDDSVHIL